MTFTPRLDQRARSPPPSPRRPPRLTASPPPPIRPPTHSQLQTEIKIHRTLHHVNVVRFERFFEDTHNAYMLLELCNNNVRRAPFFPLLLLSPCPTLTLLLFQLDD